ncbi:hypothetical protein PSI23_05510 [Xenorhabdus sp. XENO-10]|uniref:Uncharacterized protein n=1 Tax=Xenorhabdus yunnanensis TaxID=3025878 RepID=A0ABT5LCG8_9GAMM|nr:hypothetical protein [Xenorhabdus yunnanensis]MDC9588787.1 hypothetical protein [Xenorhabdus yunnanensis]
MLSMTKAKKFNGRNTADFAGVFGALWLLPNKTPEIGLSIPVVIEDHHNNSIPPRHLIHVMIYV